MAVAVETYATDHNAYPRAATLDELARELEPRYVAKIPRLDAWGAPLVYEAAACGEEGCREYYIASGGKNGKLERARPSDYAAEEPRDTSNFNEDIVFANGKFLLAPEGIGSP